MADQSERHNPPHGASVRPFARPSIEAPATPAPGAGARPAPYVSPSGSPAGDAADREHAPWPASGSEASDVTSVDPADSDEATAAAVPEQGGPPTAEGAPGDDPDASLGSPATEDAAPVIIWATPMGTPPVYPATEELEQPTPEEQADVGTWHRGSGEGSATDSDQGDAWPTRPAGAREVDRAAREPTHGPDHSRPMAATAARSGSTADAEVLERLAAKLRTGAPIAAGSGRQEAAVLARVLAELLAAGDAHSSPSQAPPGPASVEL